MSDKILQQIRVAVWQGTYEVTIPHFFEELADDDLLLQDAETALLVGDIVRRLTDDPRGTRYVIRGKIHDGRVIEVVVRMKARQRPLFITVYVLE